MDPLASFMSCLAASANGFYISKHLNINQLSKNSLKRAENNMQAWFYSFLIMSSVTYAFILLPFSSSLNMIKIQVKSIVTCSSTGPKTNEER